MKYEKIYDGKILLAPTYLTDILNNMPANVKLEEIKIGRAHV